MNKSLEVLEMVDHWEDKDEKKLSYADRKSLASSDFVFPKERRYPIPDIAHARNALSRSSGKPEEQKVKSAVYAKFPSLKKD